MASVFNPRDPSHLRPAGSDRRARIAGALIAATLCGLVSGCGALRPAGAGGTLEPPSPRISVQTASDEEEGIARDRSAGAIPLPLAARSTNDRSELPRRLFAESRRRPQPQLAAGERPLSSNLRLQDVREHSPSPALRIAERRDVADHGNRNDAGTNSDFDGPIITPGPSRSRRSAVPDRLSGGRAAVAPATRTWRSVANEPLSIVPRNAAPAKSDEWCLPLVTTTSASVGAPPESPQPAEGWSPARQTLPESGWRPTRSAAKETGPIITPAPRPQDIVGQDRLGPKIR